MYRTQKKADMHQCTRRQKRYKKYSKKFNQSIACTNAEIEQGREGKRVSSLNKRYRNKSGRIARYG